MLPTPALLRTGFVLVVVLVSAASALASDDPAAPWLVAAGLLSAGGLVAARSALGQPSRPAGGARLVERMLAVVEEVGNAYLDGDGRIDVDSAPDPQGGTIYTITIRAPELTPAVAAALRARADELAGWPGGRAGTPRK